MADDERTAPGLVALQSLLSEAPYEHDFFQAVRRLECAYRDKPRLGTGQRPVDDPVRFGQEPSLAFAASSLSRFSPGENGNPSRLSVSFFGVLGPNGPLPLHLTDYARQRIYHHGDRAFSRFLDLFHHRLLSFFYRAWANARPAVQHDRADTDRFVTYVGSLFGQGQPALRDRDAWPDSAKLYYAGRLTGPTRNAEGLHAMIRDFFGVPVEIEQFVGEWVDIPESHTWRLGELPRRGARVMGLLGPTAILGTRVWTRQHKFRIALGPLRREQFRQMLPGCQSLGRLVALVRNYLGDELKWDLRLIPAREAVPPLELGVTGQLGRTTWLMGNTNQSNWEDLILDPTRHTQEEHPVPSSTTQLGHVPAART